MPENTALEPERLGLGAGSISQNHHPLDLSVLSAKWDNDNDHSVAWFLGKCMTEYVASSIIIL